MKIDKKRLLEIINEEFDRVRGDQNMEGHMDYTDKEGKMARNQLEHIAKYAMELHQMLEPYGDELQLESWVQSKLTLAKDYMSKIKHYLESELNVRNDLPEEL